MDLVGNRIRLREYKLTDIESIYEWNQDEETTIFMGRKYRKPRKYEEIEQNINRLINTPQKDSICFAIADLKTDEYLGGIDITSIDEIDNNGILSIVIAKKEKRNIGIGKEAITLLLDFVFNVKGLHRVDLQVNSMNSSAVNCYSNLGFRNEGQKREYSKINGSYCDLIQMGILKYEWNNIRKKDT